MRQRREHRPVDEQVDAVPHLVPEATAHRDERGDDDGDEEPEAQHGERDVGRVPEGHDLADEPAAVGDRVPRDEEHGVREQEVEHRLAELAVQRPSRHPARRPAR